MTRLNALTASEAVARLAEGRIRCEALVRDCLDRIAERDSSVGAWAFLDPEAALARAREIDAAGRPGPLHGLPIGMKDIVETADMPTEYGSPIYRGHRPARDANCVRRLKAAGGMVLGKTVTVEFACRYPGKTRNPHDPARTPGGSSSGSAAAVADFMVPVATGTQTAGSVSRPASFCGVVGYKASYGRHGMEGVRTVSQTLDTLGFFGRRVADVALLAFALLDGPKANLSHFEHRPPRLGVCRTPWWEDAEEGTRLALDAAVRAAERAGATVVEADVPEEFSDLVHIHRCIMVREMVAAFATEVRDHAEGLSAELREMLAEGEATAPADYEASIAIARVRRAQFDAFMSRFDAVLAPSARGEAPVGLESTGDPLFTRAWTLLGAPSVSVPAARGPAHMPVGVEVVGPRGEDGRTLAATAWLEGALDR
jgi:Asp-tRNA(Asn)/Glu-tRNA(Gln) amidotransferase A subunit family amidase